MTHNGYCNVDGCSNFYHYSEPYCKYHQAEMNANRAILNNNSKPDRLDEIIERLDVLERKISLLYSKL